jgi:hypothetical protein
MSYRSGLGEPVASRRIASAAAILVSGVLWAQQAPEAPALVVLPIEAGADVGGTDPSVIAARIGHFLVETGEFRVLDTASRDALLREIEIGASAASTGGARAGVLLSAQGAVAGSLAPSGGRLVLTLKLVKVETGETLRSAQDSYGSPEELDRSLRALVRYLVGLQEYVPAAGPAGPVTGPLVVAAATAAPDAVAPDTGLRAVAGRWRGDRGISWVRVTSDGRAEARFDNGVIIKLAVTVRGGIYRFEQAEANRAAFYESYFEPEVAAELARVARPMVWVFELSADGKVLSGVKETTSIRVENGRMESFSNDYSRPAVWERFEQR